MKIQIHKFNGKVFEPQGYAELDRFDAEEVWHLCNWGCWSDSKPKKLHSNISCIGHGLCVTNPETQEKWLSLSNGWLKGNSIEITDYATSRKSVFDWI